jgi:hypothetical protein
VKVRAAPGPGAPADAHLEGFVPYVYRGTGRDTLTPNLQWRDPEAGRYKAKPTGKCPDCGYGRSGRNHRTLCARPGE